MSMTFILLWRWECVPPRPSVQVGGLVKLLKICQGTFKSLPKVLTGTVILSDVSSTSAIMPKCCLDFFGWDKFTIEIDLAVFAISCPFADFPSDTFPESF